jgi:hypothetical protein
MDWVATGIVVVPLLVAAGLCVVSAVKSRKNLRDRLGDTSWDFNNSWATNLGAVGSVLGIVLGAASGLPQSNLALTAAVVSILFGTLVLLGPITYLATQVEHDGSVQGTVGGFYLASGFVLWATLGEAVAAAAYFIDIADKLPPLIPWVFVNVMAIAVVMLCLYAWLSMERIVKNALDPGSPGFAPQNVQPWHLL